MVGNLLNPGALEVALTKLNATLAGAVAELQALEGTSASILGSTENEAAQLLATILKVSTALDVEADAEYDKTQDVAGGISPLQGLIGGLLSGLSGGGSGVSSLLNQIV